VVVPGGQRVGGIPIDRLCAFGFGIGFPGLAAPGAGGGLGDQVLVVQLGFGRGSVD
jgi:hypothetical protein